MWATGHIVKVWHFLQPVVKPYSSKNTLKQYNEDLDEVECIEEKAYSGSKKKSLAEKKIELITKCTNAVTNSILIESQGIKRSSFATYVEEKLSGLNKPQTTIAEKKINDVLFELECLLEMNLLIKIFNLSRMFNLSRFSTAIFKIHQSIKQSKSLPYGKCTLQYLRWFLKPNLHNGKYANTRKYRVLHGFS